MSDLPTRLTGSSSAGKVLHKQNCYFHPSTQQTHVRLVPHDRHQSRSPPPTAPSVTIAHPTTSTIATTPYSVHSPATVVVVVVAVVVLVVDGLVLLHIYISWKTMPFLDQCKRHRTQQREAFCFGGGGVEVEPTRY